MVQRDAGSARVYNDKIAMAVGRSGEVPLGQLQRVIGLQITLPDHLAGFRMQGKGPALLAQHINRLCRDRGRHAGTALIVLRVQVRRVGMFPQHGPGAGIETPDDLFFILEAHGEHALTDDGE